MKYIWILSPILAQEGDGPTVQLCSLGPKAQTVLVRPVVLVLELRSQPHQLGGESLLGLPGLRVLVPGQGSKWGHGSCAPSVSSHIEQGSSLQHAVPLAGLSSCSDRCLDEPGANSRDADSLINRNTKWALWRVFINKWTWEFLILDVLWLNPVDRSYVITEKLVSDSFILEPAFLLVLW